MTEYIWKLRQAGSWLYANLLLVIWRFKRGFRGEQR
jgi:hypothetical protein